MRISDASRCIAMTAKSCNICAALNLSVCLDAWLHFLCSSPQIAHLVFVVYIRTWWRPKRIAGECSNAPRSVLPLIFLTQVGVVMRQCPPGKTMEAPLQVDFSGGMAQSWIRNREGLHSFCSFVCVRMAPGMQILDKHVLPEAG